MLQQNCNRGPSVHPLFPPLLPSIIRYRRLDRLRRRHRCPRETCSCCAEKREEEEKEEVFWSESSQKCGNRCGGRAGCAAVRPPPRVRSSGVVVSDAERKRVLVGRSVGGGRRIRPVDLPPSLPRQPRAFASCTKAVSSSSSSACDNVRNVTPSFFFRSVGRAAKSHSVHPSIIGATSACSNRPSVRPSVLLLPHLPNSIPILQHKMHSRLQIFQSSSLALLPFKLSGRT